MIFQQKLFPLIEADELQAIISSPNLVILDISSSKNISALQPKNPGLQIAGALQVDLKSHFSRKDTDLPNMAPSPEVFVEQLKLLGIDQNTNVVIYDNLGIYTSPRLWWLFRVMGYDMVRVLNGGLDAWLEAGGEVEKMSGGAPILKVGRIQTHNDNLDVSNEFEVLQAADSPSENSAGRIDAFIRLPPHQNDTSPIWTQSDVKSNLEKPNATIVDARSPGRFEGTAPEPRAGWPSGHIPHSVNVPWKTLVDEGKYPPAPACHPQVGREVLKNRISINIPPTGPLVFSCGSGLTACIVLLAAAIVWPERELYLYDGSWVEWANPELKGCPIATG
ncbi:MAG: sulfurtransferase [Bacteroidota bacterium]